MSGEMCVVGVKVVLVLVPRVGHVWCSCVQIIGKFVHAVVFSELALGLRACIIFIVC